MNALSKLREKLARSRRYRESFAASVVKRMLPLQIRVLRKRREWSQARLAEESRVTQGVISRAEDPDYGNLTVNTLVRIGAGFDCAYIGRFVPFSELIKWYTDLEDEKSLEVLSFDEEAREELIPKGASVVILSAKDTWKHQLKSGTQRPANADPKRDTGIVERMPPASELTATSMQATGTDAASSSREALGVTFRVTAGQSRQIETTGTIAATAEYAAVAASQQQI
jgi:transcriptional regulator with XRE-family HTH domain